jgi:hypothetical protein
VKRCQMFVTKRWPGEPSVTYLCRPCARELGYLSVGIVRGETLSGGEQEVAG